MSLSASQLAHARAICGEVKARGLPQRALVIALETGFAESDLQVYANANNPESLRLPHEAVGQDHASVGIFQQQVPMWGTTADCMDPARSAGKFLDRLAQHPWQSMSNWQAAQAVQVSAYSDGSNYRRFDQAATQLAAQLWAQNGFLMALTDQQQADLYARIMGGLGQRWYTLDNAGVAHLCPQGTPGAIPAHPLDTADGNYIVQLVGQLKSEVDAIKAKVGA